MMHYLPLYFPKIERYFDGAHTDWFARFMLRFSTVVSIRQFTWDEFRKQAWELVGRKVNKQARHAHTAKFATPQVVRGPAEAMATAQVLHRHAGFSLLREADDLLFGKALLHVQSPWVEELDSKPLRYSKMGRRRGVRETGAKSKVRTI